MLIRTHLEKELEPLALIASRVCNTLMTKKNKEIFRALLTDFIFIYTTALGPSMAENRINYGAIFDLFDFLRPINNLSVKQGWVFLG